MIMQTRFRRLGAGAWSAKRQYDKLTGVCNSMKAFSKRSVKGSCIGHQSIQHQTGALRSDRELTSHVLRATVAGQVHGAASGVPQLPELAPWDDLGVSGPPVYGRHAHRALLAGARHQEQGGYW